MENRESFKSKLGFLLVSAGCAIGIGNVWKFPYVAGQMGGGVFVLFYLIFLLIIGVPTLTMEFSVGRASRQGAVGSYKALEKPGHKWHIHGWFGVFGSVLLMMYYTTVAGWMLGYFIKFISGGIQPAESTVPMKDAVADEFANMLASPGEMALWMGIVVALGVLVCSFSLQKGLERVSKFMMIGLLLLILVLVVNSLTLDGAIEGVKFYLIPDFKRAIEVGIFNVITAAMKQAFFTLSIGMACMEIFGSYMSRDSSIGGEAVKICALDTFVAIMSGMIIFPACYSFGIEPDAGPSLIFITLPNVFMNMPLGTLWGSLFFLFMTFASFSTIIAVFQNIIAACCESFGWSKKLCITVFGIFIFIASLPCVLGFNLWSGATLFGMNILDIEDFIVSGILLPVGALIYLLFCVTKWGWGFDNYIEECNTGRGLQISKKLKPYFQFVLPVLIAVILVLGFIPQ